MGTSRPSQITQQVSDDCPSQPPQEGPTRARRDARAARQIARLLCNEGQKLAELGEAVGDSGIAEMARGSLAILMPKIHREAVIAKEGADGDALRMNVANTAAKVYAVASRAVAAAKAPGAGEGNMSEEQAQAILTILRQAPAGVVDVTAETVVTPLRDEGAERRRSLAQAMKAQD